MGARSRGDCRCGEKRDGHRVKAGRGACVLEHIQPASPSQPAGKCPPTRAARRPSIDLPPSWRSSSRPTPIVLPPRQPARSMSGGRKDLVLEALRRKGLLPLGADVSALAAEQQHVGWEALELGGDVAFHEATEAYVEVCANVKVQPPFVASRRTGQRPRPITRVTPPHCPQCDRKFAQTWQRHASVRRLLGMAAFRPASLAPPLPSPFPRAPNRLPSHHTSPARPLARSRPWRRAHSAPLLQACARLAKPPTPIATQGRKPCPHTGRLCRSADGAGGHIPQRQRGRPARRRCSGGRHAEATGRGIRAGARSPSSHGARCR